MQALTPETIKQIVQEVIKEALQEALRETLSSLPTSYPRWLSTKEAVKYSGLSKDILYKLAEEGEIYVTRSPGGGKLLFDRYSIDEYLLKEQHKIKEKVDRIKKSLYA